VSTPRDVEDQRHSSATITRIRTRKAARSLIRRPQQLVGAGEGSRRRGRCGCTRIGEPSPSFFLSLTWTPASSWAKPVRVLVDQTLSVTTEPVLHQQAQKIELLAAEPELVALKGG
jgi:hypothetical protein